MTVPLVSIWPKTTPKNGASFSIYQLITCPSKTQLTKNAVRRDYRRIMLQTEKNNKLYCDFIIVEFVAYINKFKLSS